MKVHSKDARLTFSLFPTHFPGLRHATLLRTRLWHRCFPVNFATSLTTLFPWNTSGQLPLNFIRMKNKERSVWCLKIWGTTNPFSYYGSPKLLFRFIKSCIGHLNNRQTKRVVWLKEHPFECSIKEYLEKT